MALGLGGSSGGAEAAGGSPSLSYPASVVATNLVIAQVLGDNATGSVSTPANWTPLAEFASTTGTPGGGTGPRKLSLFIGWLPEAYLGLSSSLLRGSAELQGSCTGLLAR